MKLFSTEDHRTYMRHTETALLKKKKIADQTRKRITTKGSQQIQLIRELTPQELEVIELSKIDFILSIFIIFEEKKQKQCS